MFYVSDEESWTQQKRLNIIVLDIIPVIIVTIMMIGGPRGSKRRN